MDHEPQFVFAGLIPGQDPQPVAQNDKTARGDAVEALANVPVPLPRPASF
jgi:D-alanyl-D-alanine carboxypeptidase